MANPSSSMDFLGMLRNKLEEAPPDARREIVSSTIQLLMSAEADALCGADYGERVNSRNGYRPRQFDSRVGSLNSAIPKLRTGSYFPDWLLEEGTHDVHLALARLELEQRDAMAAGKGLDGLTEVIAEVGEEGRRGDGVTEVAGEEGDDLAADLKAGAISVEVDTIEALEVEHQVLIEKLVEVGDGCHGSVGDNRLLGWRPRVTERWPRRRVSRPLGERPQGSALTPGLLPPRLAPRRDHIRTTRAQQHHAQNG
jgi:hypothetical protein